MSFVNAGSLPVDVTASNVGNYFGVCGDGLDPIIFDTDGSIIRSLFGIGNENFILGVSGPECVTYTPPAITEAGAILNGRFVDGINTQLNPEISTQEFTAVFTHEFGHYIGLDHSQINLTEAFDGNNANDNAIATMFPILINGTQQATLKLDDRVSVSMLYPAPTFFANSGSITGEILRPDASTPFQGGYVIARQVSNPRLNAVGVTSGFLYAPSAPGGPPVESLKGYYELDGLAAGQSYTVELESISPQFTGGSRIGPVDPPLVVPVPEFWNGANEAATVPPDDPSASSTITVAAGTPVTGINLIMNSASGSLPSNDTCNQATAISTLPFTDTADTTGAVESVDDPVQTCTNSANANTVWYTITAPQDGILTVDTCGSDYDTVLTAFTGSCGAPTSVACNDDVGSDPLCGATQSRIQFDVFAGNAYLIEAAQFGAPLGGSLVLNVSIGPRNCEQGRCLPGSGSAKAECVAEWLLNPPPVYTSKRPPTRVVCHDGDSCDADEDPNNHSCTFQVALCFNNHDSSLTKCSPSDTTTVEMMAPDRNGKRNRPEDTPNADALLNAIASTDSSASVLGICKNRVVGPPCLDNADCDTPGRHDGRCYVFVRFSPSLTTARPLFAVSAVCGTAAHNPERQLSRRHETYPFENVQRLRHVGP